MSVRARLLLAVILAAPAIPAAAAPVAFDLPEQSAASAMLALSEQAGIEVVFPYDELRSVPVPALRARLEPPDALARLLRGTGFAAHRYAPGKYVVRSTAQPAGSIRGRILDAAGDPLPGATITTAGHRVEATTDARGEFVIPALAPGRHRLLVAAAGQRALQIEGVEVEAHRISQLPDQALQPVRDLERLDPYVVEGRSTRMRPIDDSAALLGPRRATGNLDLPRTADDALPFAIYTREQITRSGVVALNEFLQRAILEGDASALPPEQSATFDLEAGLAGSSNLRLRGYDENETVILINGRRLPEVQTSVTRTLPPDVNFIPLSLIQQVEVLPASASALYSGNPVGGVINIVLRPDITATELSATYTNALGRYDAPQSSFSLQHGQSLLDGKLRLRLSAVYTASEPSTEEERGLRRAQQLAHPPAPGAVHRATPNVRSADPESTGLFGPGTPTFTSVAPGADGTGGVAAFAGRAGVRSLALFDSSAPLAASTLAADSPYGRRQQRAVWFGSVTWDPAPWLQLGMDANHSRTEFTRGVDVLTADLTLAASSPFNPFGQEITVALTESTPLLGPDYGEARIDFSSIVAGALVRLPHGWNLTADAQFARNTVDYRGLAGVDLARWQELVDAGRYNPLRDTQVHAPPAEFYDRVVVYRGGRGEFVRLGDYTTLDGAARLSHQALPLPTGRGSWVVGADYRLQRLGDFLDSAEYGDGTAAGSPMRRAGRTLERYSFFTELQAPLLPVSRLPRGLRALEGDFAVRYVASANSNEVNTAPTVGLRAAFAGGVSLRGSMTTSNRFPTPQLSREIHGPGPDGGFRTEHIFDPRRGEFYDVRVDEALDVRLPPEEAVTQTAGVVFERGNVHRLRASLDFVDTRKTNEIRFLEARQLPGLEASFPERVERAAPAPGDPRPVGRITRVVTGSVNATWRRSQNWNAAAEYAWTGCAGGTLEVRAHLLYYQRFERQFFDSSPVVDQLAAPDGSEANLMRYRATFGAAWSNRRFGFGVDGQYFHSRVVPELERTLQGSDRIKPFWQFDAYVQADLSRLLPGDGHHRGLRAQLRVNNLSGFDFPKYANHSSGTGVQPYGDWRGRTYSLSLTTTF